MQFWLTRFFTVLAIGLLAGGAGCRFVATQPLRPNHDAGRVVLFVDAPENAPAGIFHDDYVAAKRRLIAVLEREHDIEVKPMPPKAEACAAIEAGAADYILTLAVTPQVSPQYGFWDGFWSVFQACDLPSRHQECHQLRPAPAPRSFESSVTVELVLEKLATKNGRPQHVCDKGPTLGAWHSVTVNDATGEGWQPLVRDQLARSVSWFDAHLSAQLFGVDTEPQVGELPIGSTAGVRTGDAFSIGDNGYLLALDVAPTTTRVERLWDSAMVAGGLHAVDQGRPWVLTMQPHGGVARLVDNDVAETASALGFDVRLGHLASGPIVGIGYDAVVGDHHTLMFAGPELGWSVRASSALELHAIGQLSGGLNSKAASDGTRKTGAGATAALGLSWNTRVVFTSLDIGYAYSTVFAPDPTSKIEQRGPFARVAFGFSAYH